MRLRLLAPVLAVIAVTAGAFALTLAEASGAAWLVLAGGLALAVVTGTLAATAERRRRAVREVDRFFTLSPELVIVAGFDGYWKRVNPTVEAVLGYSEREALSRPFMEFVHATSSISSRSATRIRRSARSSSSPSARSTRTARTSCASCGSTPVPSS